MIDSFNLSHVYGSTHVDGQTLDIILTHGLSVGDVKIHNLALSDHMPMTCTVTIPCVTPNTLFTCRQVWKLNVQYSLKQPSTLVRLIQLRAKYFVDLLLSYCSNPTISFSTINSVLNPATTCPALSTITCGDLLKYFCAEI